MALVCAACGASSEPDARFCDSCGQALGEADPSADAPKAPGASPSPIEKPSVAAEGERRQATVLFSDLSGYTAMNERLDPEEVETIVSRIKADAAEIVERHGGIVNQFVGDEVLALFGIPTAHEDDPVRAVRAARELHAMVRRMSPEVEQAIGQPLDLHTGINTGLVVTHLRDDREGRYGITGDTVNTAARLVAQANAGEILVSPETRRRIADFFTTEALEPVAMKGKARPMVPYRVTGETAAQSRFEAAERRGLTRFAGREIELATLQACLQKAVAGQGQFVTVNGEAGLGKSRLLYEFRHALDRDKVAVHQGRCQSYGTHTPYLPFLDALRRGLDLRDEDSPQALHDKAVANVIAVDPALEQYLPHYLHLLTIPGEAHNLPGNLQGGALRLALEDALAAINIQYSRHKPLVLVFEDWHWADEASDSALKRLAGLIANNPVMLVVNYRPEYRADWGSLGHHTGISLKPLESAHAERVSRSVFGAETLPQDLTQLLHERTGGNPFFIEEICQALLEDGSVVVNEDRATLNRSLEALEVPDTVEAVIRTRVDRLEADARETLRLASVIGREFTRRILERMVKTDAELSPILESLGAQDLIQQTRLLPEAQYMFKHALMQGVVYETLLLQQRKTLHAIVGQAIETLYADRLEEHVEMLAHHFAKSEDADKGVMYLELAGRKAVRNSAFSAAIQHYLEAISLLDTLENTSERMGKRFDLTIRWANAAHVQPTPDLIGALQNSLDLARDLGDDLLIARLCRHLGFAHCLTGKPGEGIPLLQRSLEIAESIGDERQIALATCWIGQAYHHAGNERKEIEYLEQGIPMMEKLGNEREVSYSLSYLGEAYGWMGNYGKSRELCQRALEIAHAINDLGCESEAFWGIGRVEAEYGHWQRAEEIMAKTIEVAIKVNYRPHLSDAYLVLGQTAFYTENPTEGIALMEKAVDAVEPNQSNPLAFYPFLPDDYEYLAYYNALASRWDEARRWLAKAESLQFDANRGKVFAAMARALMAAQEDQQDWGAVKNHMHQAVSLASKHGFRPGLAECHFRYAVLLHRKGDQNAAGEQLDKAMALFQEMEMPWWMEQAEMLRERMGIV